MSNLDTKRLISIAKRISGSDFDNLSPQSIYAKLTSEFPYKDITLHLKPLDVIVLTFIIPFIGKEVVIETLINDILFNLFSFSVIEVETENSDVTCDSCSGDGVEDCSSCDGDGKVQCTECGGEGEDGDGNTCDYCDGEGTEECGDCYGDGNVSCDSCDGSGEETDYNSCDVAQFFLVTYNSKIKNNVVLRKNYDEIKNTTFTKFLDNKKTIVIHTIRKSVYKEWEPEHEFDAGDYFLYEFSEEPTFTKVSYKIYPGDITFI